MADKLDIRDPFSVRMDGDLKIHEFSDGPSPLLANSGQTTPMCLTDSLFNLWVART